MGRPEALCEPWGPRRSHRGTRGQGSGLIGFKGIGLGFMVGFAWEVLFEGVGLRFVFGWFGFRIGFGDACRCLYRAYTLKPGSGLFLR